MAASSSTNYPARLSDHLREISQEKHNDMKMYTEWYFERTDDTRQATSLCPCGKQGLRYLCYIKNKHTQASTYVGTTCIELFDEEMKEVLKLVHGLISDSIRGKYKGISNANPNRHRFEVRANTRLVKKSQFLKRHVQHVQIYQKSNGKWEIQVHFETPLQQVRLREDRSYRLRMKCARWEKDYGNGMTSGITFRVIECLEG